MQAKADRSQVLESDIFVQSFEHAQHILTDIYRTDLKRPGPIGHWTYLSERKKKKNANADEWIKLITIC